MLQLFYKNWVWDCIVLYTIICFNSNIIQQVSSNFWLRTIVQKTIISGAMVAICDLNEYRACTKGMGPLVTELFETLHALCNLLLVKPENLQQVCSEDSLVFTHKFLYTYIFYCASFRWTLIDQRYIISFNYEVTLKVKNRTF